MLTSSLATNPLAGSGRPRALPFRAAAMPPPFADNEASFDVYVGPPWLLGRLGCPGGPSQMVLVSVLGG